MKIIILSEGGKNIGLGHITRCMALYEAFKQEGISPLFIVNGDKAAEKALKGYDHVIFNWIDDKKRLFDMARGADIVVIDSYMAGAGIYKEVSRIAKTSVYIDDNMRVDYPAGIVVNGAISAGLLKYPKNGRVKYLLGSSYIPLRKEFWRVPAKRINSNVRSVMITFGGADGKNMTPRVLELLNVRYPELVKNVIAGTGFKNTRAIEKLKDKNVNLIYKPDAERMRAAMLRSDIAVSAAGQTLYELARIGVPTIAVCVADNQRGGVRSWQKRGFIKYSGQCDSKGLLDKVSAAIIELAPSKKRRKASAIGRNLVDGRGAERIAKYLIKEKAS